MNPFADLTRPIVSRPGDALEEPARAPRAARGPMPERLDLPVIANPWGLSPVECEVMRQSVDLLNTKEIGAALGRSPKTIEIHRERMKEKMGAKNLIHAVLIWDRHFRQREPA